MVDPHRELDVVRDAGHGGVHDVGGIEQERRERRRRRHDRVTQPPGDRETRAVAAALRQRLTAGREHNGRCQHIAAIRDDAEPGRCPTIRSGV